MMVNKVELCGVNTSKLPLLKEEEKGSAVCPGSGRGRRGEGGVHQGKPEAGLKRDQAFRREQ